MVFCQKFNNYLIGNYWERALKRTFSSYLSLINLLGQLKIVNARIFLCAQYDFAKKNIVSIYFRIG